MIIALVKHTKKKGSTHRNFDEFPRQKKKSNWNKDVTNRKHERIENNSPSPESSMVRVLLALSGIRRISKLGSEFNTEPSVKEQYLILSRASELLEISSLKKISLLLS